MSLVSSAGGPTRRSLLLLLLVLAGGAGTPSLVTPAYADDGAGESGGNSSDSDDDGSTGDEAAPGGGTSENDDDEDDDHEYALQHRKSGELRSLDEILKRIVSRHDGQVLDVKLRREKGRTWYEIRILTRHDRVRTLRAPASRKIQNFGAGRK